MTHTEGPYEIGAPLLNGHGGFEIIRPGGVGRNVVGLAYRRAASNTRDEETYTPIGQREAWANAHLFAASWSLLAVARAFVQRHENIPVVPVNGEYVDVNGVPTPPADGWGGCVCSDCVSFKRAIAQAEGKPDPYPPLSMEQMAEIMGPAHSLAEMDTLMRKAGFNVPPLPELVIQAIRAIEVDSAGTIKQGHLRAAVAADLDLDVPIYVPDGSGDQYPVVRLNERPK